MSRAARAYLRAVRSRMYCPRSAKAVFLRQLEDEIYLYCAEHTDADSTALSRRFGTPDAVAEEFIAGLDPMIFSREYQNRKKLLALGLVLALSVALIALCLGLRSYRQTKADGSMELLPYEGELPEMEGDGFWVRTNNGQDVEYWTFDYKQNQWVHVPLPTE